PPLGGRADLGLRVSRPSRRPGPDDRHLLGRARLRLRGRSPGAAEVERHPRETVSRCGRFPDLTSESGSGCSRYSQTRTKVRPRPASPWSNRARSSKDVAETRGGPSRRMDIDLRLWRLTTLSADRSS